MTSRRKFGLAGLLLDLNVLSPDAAVALLRELGVQAEEDALQQLAAACGRLPLALRVAAAYLRNRKDWSVETYLTALERERLKHLSEEGEGDVAAVLGLSLERLEKERPDLAQRWRMLAVMPAPFDRALAAGVWGKARTSMPASLPGLEGHEDELGELWRALQALLQSAASQVEPLGEEETRETLSELTRWSLLEYDRETDLYRMHDLLREVAGGPEEGAVWRHAQVVLQEAEEAHDRFLKGDLAALARFDQVWPHLRVAWARMKGKADDGARRWQRDFGYAFIYLLALRTTPAERIPYLKGGVDAARALGDKGAEGALLGNLGLAYAALGRVEEAIGCYQQALAIAREIGDRRGEGNRLGNLGRIYAMAGDWQQGVALCRQFLEIKMAISDAQGQGVAWSYLGYAYARAGEFDKAIAYHQKGIAMLQEGGYRFPLVEAWVDLAETYWLAGRYEEARETAKKAMALAQELGAKRYEALASWTLGLVYEKQGRYAEAAALMRVLVDYERAIGHPDAEKDAQRLAEVEGKGAG